MTEEEQLKAATELIAIDAITDAFERSMASLEWLKKYDKEVK